MTIENVILTTDNCRYCLMCRHVCPVENVTFRESLNPHGWGLVIASVRRGLVEWTESTVDVLYSCADCGICRANCVTDQPLPSAIAAARAEVAGLDLAPVEVSNVRLKLEDWGNPFEALPPLEVEGMGKAALFVGDEAKYVWPGALDAALDLLDAVGIQPVLIGAGRNNGYLASSLGFPEMAHSLAQATLDDLKATGASRLFVLTPGDFYTFGQLYDERLGVDWPGDVELLEVVPFLAEQLELGTLKLSRSGGETPYAYIDPTHSVRVKTRFDAPRKLLAAIMPAPARELFWRRERAHPCGNTALQFTQPHLSEKLARSRLEDAQTVGAQSIITEAPGGLSHLSRYAAEYGIQVAGLYELLVDHLTGA